MSNKYIFQKKCDFCGNFKKSILYRLKGQNVVSCDRCGLVFLDKQRSDFENLYNVDYYFESKNNKKAHYVDYSVEEKVVRENFNFAYEYIKKSLNPKRNKLFEIGAGFGYFLKYLPKEVSSEAVEVSEEAAGKIRDAGFKVCLNDFNKMKIRKKFDYIVSFDVIEHQNYLVKYITRVNLLLKRGGVFIFTTPDFGTIFNKILRKHAPLIRPLYHNYYFDKKWLEKNMPSFGFEVIHMKTVNIAKMSIGYILLESSFSFPVIRKLKLLKLARLLKADKIIIPFFRFGGIECILKKIN